MVYRCSNFFSIQDGICYNASTVWLNSLLVPLLLLSLDTRYDK